MSVQLSHQISPHSQLLGEGGETENCLELALAQISSAVDIALHLKNYLYFSKSRVLSSNNLVALPNTENVFSFKTLTESSSVENETEPRNEKVVALIMSTNS